MEAIIFLSIIIALFSIFVSCLVIRRVKKQIAEITDALADVKNGNGNRRILSATNELVAPLAYEINEIVVSYEKRLSTVRQAEETNRQLMTSLSHDVRTPLTTLIGYLDAAHGGIVTGKDKDDYIETARRKAHDLKEYIDILFDWFKLNSNEFAMDINTVEAAELTRNILIDWIPIFEDRQIDYNIDIPEQPFRVKLIGVIAAMLFFMERDNDTFKNLRTIPVTSTQMVLAKIFVLFLFGIIFCVASTIATILCGLGTLEVYGLGYKLFLAVETGIFITAGTLPLIVLVVFFSKTYVFSILLCVFYSVLNMSATALFDALPKTILWFLPTPLTTFWSAGDMAAHGIKMDLEQMTGLIPSTFQVVMILGIMAIISFWLIDRLYKQRGE